MSRRAIVGWLCLLALGGAAGSPRLRAADAPAAPIPPSWVTIAEVEHGRGDPSRLDPFLAADADPVVRARAVTALGRLGNRRGVTPRVRDLLRRGGGEAVHVLWAAGLVGDPALVPDVLPFLDGDVAAGRGVIVAALDALGRLGDPRADGYAAAFLEGTDPTLVVAALDALWRMGAERNLERVLALPDAEPVVRRAAALAAWRLAAARRMAVPQAKRAAWSAAALADGAPTRWARDADPETRLFALRAINALLPEAIVLAIEGLPFPGGNLRVHESERTLLGAVQDPDPRIVADVAFRLGGAHTGRDVADALVRALGHDDPLVRETAADAVAALVTKDASAGGKDRFGLEARTEAEADARVRAALLRARAASGEEAVVTAAAGPAGPRTPEEWRDAALVVAASRANAATARLAEMLARPDLPTLARIAVLDALSERPAEARFVALSAPFLADADRGVRATAAAVLAHHATGTDGSDAEAVAALAAAYQPDGDRDDVDARQAVVGALGEIAADGKTPADAVARATTALRAALADPAPAVRLTARTHAGRIPALAEAAKGEDPRPNEWRGLPRPRAPLLGLDLTPGDPWLSEEEILLLAAAIERKRPVVVLETTQGTIRLETDPVNAPVHAVNLVLCAASGVYDGTPWHRVVPAFVIQGGDPRGDGSGDAGWSIPDEITTTRFQRGVLGMPKSTKDTGGCQLFLMHVAAPHLDGGYTAYGRAVSGLEVVDRVRVGDRILKATVEVPGR